MAFHDRGREPLLFSKTNTSSDGRASSAVRVEGSGFQDCAPGRREVPVGLGVCVVPQRRSEPGSPEAGVTRHGSPLSLSNPPHCFWLAAAWSCPTLWERLLADVELCFSLKSHLCCRKISHRFCSLLDRKLTLQILYQMRFSYLVGH